MASGGKVFLNYIFFTKKEYNLPSIKATLVLRSAKRCIYVFLRAIHSSSERSSTVGFWDAWTLLFLFTIFFFLFFFLCIFGVY